MRKEFTKLKSLPENAWLYETSNNATKQAIKDACEAYKRYFKGLSGLPRYKSRKRSRPKFYNDNVKLKYKEGFFLIEKVGWVRISEPERIFTNKFYNPRVSFDNKYWYISVGVEITKPSVDLTDKTVGIDLGIKNLAVCSNEMTYENVNKRAGTKKQSKRLRRLQRKLSRKYEKNKQGEEYVKTKNIKKLEKRIKLVHRKIANMRLNHIQQTTAEIVKTKPCRVVVENLNVKGMMRNRHLSKAIAEQGFNIFKRALAYKCDYYGIIFTEADKFYPSSKKCCKCGYIKKDLKLSERIYKCPVCGNEIDRDYQASINLAEYPA